MLIPNQLPYLLRLKYLEPVLYTTRINTKLVAKLSIIVKDIEDRVQIISQMIEFKYRSSFHYFCDNISNTYCHSLLAPAFEFVWIGKIRLFLVGSSMNRRSSIVYPRLTVWWSALDITKIKAASLIRGWAIVLCTNYRSMLIWSVYELSAMKIIRLSLKVMMLEFFYPPWPSNIPHLYIKFWKFNCLYIEAKSWIYDLHLCIFQIEQ